MKGIFKLGIKLYWKIVPDKIKGVCLFHESCSRYVFRKLDEDGFNSGVKGLVFRLNNCRNPYMLRKIPKTNKYELHLRSGVILEDSEINPNIKSTSKNDSN